MKKLLLLPFLLLTMSAMAACSSDDNALPNEDKEEQTDPDNDNEGEGDDQPEGKSTILVAYFSQSGNTQGVAERIAELTGADTYRILAEDPYEGDGYPDTDRIQDEAYNDRRPGVANLPENLDEYDTIFVGTPIWWHYPAMVVCTFLDNYDFKGIFALCLGVFVIVFSFLTVFLLFFLSVLSFSKKKTAATPCGRFSFRREPSASGAVGGRLRVPKYEDGGWLLLAARGWRVFLFSHGYR